MFDFIHLTIPPAPALFAQLLVGLINGAFYALLSLGLAVIFGLLNIINFAHGAQYMMGAFCAWFLLNIFGLGYWPALVLAPLIVGVVGIAIERLFLRHIYRLDPLYGLLLTFGLALIIEGVFRQQYGSSGQPYAIPPALQGGRNLGFMFLPNYRAGVMAAPIYQVSPLMGSNIIITVFAVVVIGGMGSILGAIVSGFALGLVEGLTKVFYPEASSTVIFVVMALVLLVKPAGFFGRAR